MKIYATLLWILFSTCIIGFSQGVILNAGDTWSYQFTTLPYVGVTVQNPGSAVPEGAALCNLSGFDSSVDRIDMKMYENSLSEAPIFDSSGNTPPYFYEGVKPGGWQDLQGWVTLSVSQGSVTLTSVEFDVYTALSGTSLNHYQAIIPVPEPSPTVFLSFAGAMAFAWKRFRKNR